MALPPDRTDRGAERYLKDDWHGLQLFAIDGAQFRTPDKPELREYYGSANTSTKRQNAYPVMRLVALMNLGSHILLNAVTAPYRQSETVLAHSMLATIPDNSITLFDKLFYSEDLLLTLNQKGCNRHWLLPAWKNIASEMIELGNTASPGTIPKRLEHLRGCSGSGVHNKTPPTIKAEVG